MKKNHLRLLVVLIAICFTVLTSCEDEPIEASLTFDCPDLELDFGDPCENINAEIGIIDENCECFVEQSPFDCPNFNANIGDPCQAGWGVIDENCDCVEANACNYQGVVISCYQNGNNPEYFPESECVTDIAPDGGVEVNRFTSQESFIFTTYVTTEGQTGDGNIEYNGVLYQVSVTCLKSGSAVGEEFRWDITLDEEALEAEICVVIDDAG